MKTRSRAVSSVLAWSLLLIMASACGLISGQSQSVSQAPIEKPSDYQPANPQQPQDLPSVATAAALPPGVFFADDFSNPLSGWDVRNDAQAITDYRDGEFVIYVGKIDTTLWSNANHHMVDVAIDVDVRQAAGPDDNLFGVICRYRDADDFYRLVIGGNGFAGITKRANGVVTVLSGPALTRSDAVNRGQATNHIRAVCQGPELSLYVNDQLVAQVVDAEFPEGDVGLLASAGKHPGVEVHFAQFVASAP